MASMMKPSELEGIFKRFDLVELSGQLQTNRHAKVTSVQVQIEGAHYEDNDDAISLRAVAKMTGEDAESGEEFEVYEGSAQYFMVLNEGDHGLTDDEIVILAWPSLRTVLTTHAKLLGVRNFKVPFAITEASPAEEARH